MLLRVTVSTQIAKVWSDIAVSRFPPATQREEDIRLIVGESLVGGGDRRFGGCEACLDVEYIQDCGSAETEQGGGLAACLGGAVARLPQFPVMVDLANIGVERGFGLLKGQQHRAVEPCIGSLGRRSRLGDTRMRHREIGKGPRYEGTDIAAEV